MTAPTVAVDIEALKAEIAADFLEIEEANEQLVRNPTLEGLEERAAAIAVPGSVSYVGVVEFIEELVADGQRMAPGEPDYSSFTVESVEIVGNPGDGEAIVTYCDVTNRIRVALDGTPVPGSGTLFAARLAQPVSDTPDGWRWSEAATGITIERGATACPAS